MRKFNISPSAMTEKIGSCFPVQSFLLSLLPAVAVNAIISMVISYPLLVYGTKKITLFVLAVNLIAFVSHYFLLNFIVGIIVFLFSGILYQRVILFLRILLFFLLQSVLLVDTKIYSLFHYHINSLVWNVLTTEGVTDSVILGKETILIFSVLLAIIFSGEVIIHVSLAGLYKKIKPENLSFLMKTAKIIFALCISLIIFDKGIYAYGDLFNITDITKNTRLYPLYQPFTIKRLASNLLHMKVNRELDFKVSASNTSLRYPLKALAFDPSENRNYNIIVVALEGLRFDNLNRDIMPNTWSFGQQNIVYNNHYSGGNGTRFGLFSLFYGINGAYWQNFLAQRRSPLLIDSLIDKGYDFQILSSTRLTFPEFRKTAFIRIPEYIEDTVSSGDATERDRIITDKLIDHIGSRKTQKPFFAFLFYNSSHQPYLYPKEFEKFLPVGNSEINYFKDTDKENISRLKNRYRNAVLYDDFLIGKIISSLKKSGMLEKTILLITGDHGEEFYENGFMGHTSSFDDYQTKTVFVLHYPGIKNQVISRITSHLDLVPTLMESLGCTSPAGDYSQGVSLIGNGSHEYVNVANWDNAAIVDKDTEIVYSTELYNMGKFEVHRKADYCLIDNAGQLLKQKKHFLLEVLHKMSEFY